MELNLSPTWGAVSAILRSSFTFYDIKDIVGLAGFDTGKIAHLVQKSGGTVSKGQLLTAIDQGLSDFTDSEKRHFLNIAVEEVLERKPHVESQLKKYLSRLGWHVIDGVVLAIEILDRRDLEELDTVARNDLVKSAERFRDGDLSGSLSAACGAVDSVTAKIYETNQLGDPGKASFQERCKVSLNAVGVFTAITDELKDLEWKETNVGLFSKNFEGALNQATYVMQSLRANMSDVHGTKPVLKPLVFDSIKWAQIIIRLLS